MIDKQKKSQVECIKIVVLNNMSANELKLTEYSFEPEPRKSCLSYLKLITVEPTMVLYMMAFMTTSVVEQAFFVYKACRVNHNLTEEICTNITAYQDLNKQVQLTVSTFDLWNSIASHALPIILSLFMGAWSDKRGRKWPLLIGLVGKFIYSVMIVVNALQPTWPVEYIIYTASLPCACTGADVAIFAAAFTYLVETCSQESRTMRVTLLEVFYLATMPTGIALGKYLFSYVTHRSYAIMFTINATMMFFSIVYTFIRLEWRTSPRQKPLKEANNIFTDFFDYHHVLNTGRTLFKRRESGRRGYLLILIVMMGLYTFQRDEKNTSYLYLQQSEYFKWTVNEVSDFRTFQSTIQDLFLLIAIPLMSKVFKWRDTIIIMIGAMAHAIGRIFYVTAQTAWMFYLGGFFVSIGPIVAPVIRSIVSKMVSAAEKGKAFSVLSAADNAIPILSGVAYSQLYNATLYSYPHAIFFIAMVTQSGVFLLVLYMHFKANDEDLIHEDDEAKTGDWLQTAENKENN